MPGRQQHTTVAASMLHVLQRVQHVRDEAEAEGEAVGEGRPGAAVPPVSAQLKQSKAICAAYKIQTALGRLTEWCSPHDS